MQTKSALYHGQVRHVRVRPTRHSLNYAVFSMLIDLDELAELDRNVWAFGVNRRSLLSFWERDHGTGEVGRDKPLKERVLRTLREAGYAIGGDANISLLCYPRLFGYVFNPLTVYYVRDGNGTLQIIIYEVLNTFKERHSYILPVSQSGVGDGQEIMQATEKKMYVSPFTPLEGHYDFRMHPPETSVLVSVKLSDCEGPLLLATFDGKREPLSRWALVRAWCRYPLMTLKVTVAIHYEALKLLIKRVPIVRHGAERKPDRVTTA